MSYYTFSRPIPATLLEPPPTQPHHRALRPHLVNLLHPPPTPPVPPPHRVLRHRGGGGSGYPLAHRRPPTHPLHPPAHLTPSLPSCASLPAPKVTARGIQIHPQSFGISPTKPDVALVTILKNAENDQACAVLRYVGCFASLFCASLCSLCSRQGV